VSQWDVRSGLLTLEPEAEPRPGGFLPPVAPETPPEEPSPDGAEERGPKPPDLSKARAFLTSPHPSGFGELLVTDVWLPPAPKADASEPVDRQQAWRKRQEYRELNLLREKPAASYDARTERYWKQVKEALALAPGAIVDPYTTFAAGLADADYEHMGDCLRESREYGHTADSLLRYGRACLAIGRLKSARSALAKAVRSEPYQAEAWWNLGIAHLFARANAEASEAFGNALDQSPGDLRYQTALAVARYHQRKYPQAEEHFRRTAGASGLRAAARSLLACSLCMQGNWDEARIELNFLKSGGSAGWAQVADQCADCVARGEERQGGPLAARRRGTAMLKSLAAVGATGAYLAYSFAENWFRDNLRWAAVPLFLLVGLVGRSLRSVANATPAGAYGNYEQGLPCWQATSWMRPRRGEL